jgi:hypothetical protein
MNKRILILSIAFIAMIFYANAQSSFGVKAGLSYNTTGELKEFVNETGSIIDNKGNGKSGYNFGIYGKIGLGPIYLRPELVYTKTTSKYILNLESVDYKMSKLDLPVLVGIKVIGPLSVYAGPTFQYVLDNDLQGLQYENVENDFTIGLNFGASLELGRLGLDVRYERGFTQNEVEFTGVGSNVIYRLDSRPEQIIFGLSYRLTAKK